MKHLDQSQKCPAPKQTWTGRLVLKTDLFYTVISSSFILERVRVFFSIIRLSKSLLNNKPQLQVPGTHISIWFDVGMQVVSGCSQFSVVLQGPLEDYPCFKGEGAIYRGPAPSQLLFYRLMCSSRVTPGCQVKTNLCSHLLQLIYTFVGMWLDESWWMQAACRVVRP